MRAKDRTVDKRSYIKFECDKAVEANIKIIILYNDTKVDRTKCPAAVRYTGTHAKMLKYENGQCCWDYQSVKNAFDN
jgi:hypothetical protein